MTGLPLISALRKHLIVAGMIVLEIALACAVLCNTMAMVRERWQDFSLSNAIDEASLAVVTVHESGPGSGSGRYEDDAAALSHLPGVHGVALMNTVPLSGSAWSIGVQAHPPGTNQGSLEASTYLMTEGGPQVLGLKLIQGRFFIPSEYADGGITPQQEPSSHVVLVTAMLAKQLWPNQSPLGKVLYASQRSYIVVGEVENVLQSTVEGVASDYIYAAAFFPAAPQAGMSQYVMRCEAAQCQNVQEASVALLERNHLHAFIKGSTYQELRDGYFSSVSAMAWILLVLSVVMLAITAIGISGLTSFSVQQRRRSIGIRRALGAKRTDILTHFLLENLLLVSIGVVLGVVGAYGLNIFLGEHFEMTRMPWTYPFMAATMLVVVGQFSAFLPSRRASAVHPIEALRGST
jgi:putative ABC transport system permease protein